MTKEEMEKMILNQTIDSVASSVLNCMDRFDSLNKLYEDIFKTKSQDKSKVRFAGAVVLGVSNVLNGIIDNAPVNRLGKKKFAEELQFIFRRQLDEWCHLATAVEDEKISSIHIGTFKGIKFPAYSSLYDSGIETVGDVMKAGRLQLMKLPHIGKITIDAINNNLKEFGLKLPEKSLDEIYGFEEGKHNIDK